MNLIYCIAIVLGGLILVILLSLALVEDQGARIKVRCTLLRSVEPTYTTFRQRMIATFGSVPVPYWFKDRLNPQTVVWAGIPLTEGQFLSLWWLTSWLGFLGGGLVIFLTPGSLGSSSFGLLFFFCGTAFPYYLLQHRIRTRWRTIERELPDFLDTLTFTVEAGLGLVPAIKRVAAGLGGTLSHELELALLQIDLGFSHKEALQGLSNRVPITDIEGFVESILLAERLGTSLSRALRIQSNLLRARRRQRAEIKAQTAPIRIIPALVFFFLPSLLLIYLAPPIINFLIHR